MHLASFGMTRFYSVVLFHILIFYQNSCLFSASSLSSPTSSHKILSEKVTYSRYRTVLQRKVEFNNNNSTSKIVDFDVIDQRGVGAVIIVAFNTKTKTFRLLREYNPGCDEVLYGPAAGLVEKKHELQTSDKDSVDENVAVKQVTKEELLWKEAAKWELEEECHLRGGTWYELGEKTAMDKYVVTRVKPFLVLDATHVDDPRPLDIEEEIEIVDGVSVERIWEIINHGEMNLVGGWACLLAIHKLQELGII